MTDPPQPDALKNLAIVLGALALVFVGVAGFEAVVGITTLAHPLPIAGGLGVAAAVCLGLSRRAGPPTA